MPIGRRLPGTCWQSRVAVIDADRTLQIYRLFYVYSRNVYICILPVLLWLGQLVGLIGLMLATHAQLYDSLSNPVFLMGASFENAQAACTFCLNVLATGPCNFLDVISAPANRRDL